MRLGDRPLMVTQDSHHTVSVVVGIQLLLHGSIFRRTLVELLLECDRRVVRTEHLRSEALHVI